MKTIVALISLTIGTNAVAEEAPVLWQNIRLGMTPAQVIAAYPEAKLKRDRFSLPSFRIIDGCPATVSGEFKNGGLTKVFVGTDPWKPARLSVDCPKEALTAMSAKYGEPTLSEHKSGEELYRWTINGMVIEMTITHTNANVFHATYSAPQTSNF